MGYSWKRKAFHEKLLISIPIEYILYDEFCQGVEEHLLCSVLNQTMLSLAHFSDGERPGTGRQQCRSLPL